jgi:hypothetical protein
MNQPEMINTILVIDIDRAVTRAILCDVVENSARLVEIAETPSTIGPPFLDLSIGATRALRMIEEETGRRVLDGERILIPATPDGDGVDALFVTGMPVALPRIALHRVGDGELGRRLGAALLRVTVEVRDAAGYLEPGSSTLTFRAAEDWLRDAGAPVLIVLSDGDSSDVWRATLETIAGVVADHPIEQGIIVADERRQHFAASVFDDTVELSGIDPAEYRPSEIAIAIETEVRERYAGQLQQERALRPFAVGTYVDRIHAVENVAAYLHRRMGRNVATFQVLDGALFQIATASGASVAFRADLDLGWRARSLLELGPDRFLRWLPFQLTEDDVTHWILNRALRPHAILEGSVDRQIAGACARELLRRLVESAGARGDLDVDLVVIGRELLDLSEELGLLVALDGMQPAPSSGLVMVSVDTEGVMPSLGAIASEYPDYAREVIENDFLAPLASCIVVRGTGAEGDVAASGQITTENGRVHRFVVQYGHLHRIPLDEDKTADVEIRPEATMSIGRREPGEPVHFRGEGAVHGGRLGLVIDARGRPVSPPPGIESRIASHRRWISDLGGEAE